MFKIIGTSNDFDSCENCGRENLKRVVVLGVLDADGTSISEMRVGTQCAATLTGKTSLSSVKTLASRRNAATWRTRWGSWFISGNLHEFTAEQRATGVVHTSFDTMRPGFAENIKAVIEKERKQALEISKRKGN